jgi:transcription antitermination factor NusB
MTRRRKAREVALQFLYQLDLQGEADPAHAAEFWAQHPLDDDTREFAQDIVHGATKTRASIDEIIARFTEHWDLDRMAVVDRNILRLAVYELGWRQETPPKVVINEAIEIAKKFGTRESSRFINGILDRVHRELRPAS